jgi:hypothetical protein
VNIDPVIVVLFVAIGVWVFFFAGHQGRSGTGGGANDPEAIRLKAQAMKEAAIQAAIDAELRGEIDAKTRNAQIAHLSRLPTNPQDGSGGSR